MSTDALSSDDYERDDGGYVVYPWADELPLGKVREIMRTLVYEGAHCPCCTQVAKVYRRPINRSMARDLILAWRRVGIGQPFHLPHLLADSGDHREGDFSKLRFWGMVAEEAGLRPDGGRAGWWHVTTRGQEFVLNRLTVPKYAVIYDNRCLRLDGEEWSVVNALGKRFNYGDLMSGVVRPPEPPPSALGGPEQKPLF